MQAPKPMLKYPYDRGEFLALDKECLVDLIFSLDSKSVQVGDFACELVREKYGSKSERFEGNGQLLLFPAREQIERASDKDNVEEVDTATEIDNAGKGLRSNKPKKAKTAGHSRNKMPDDLPRVPVIANALSEAELACECKSNCFAPGPSK